MLLNGPTSSGKTSIARAFQRMSDDPWLRIGVDVFWSAIDERWMEFGPFADEGFRWVEVAGNDGAPAEMKIVPGQVGERLATGMRAAVEALARNGHDVIVDDALIRRAWLDDWSLRVGGFDTLFVGVHCDLETLEGRERERGNRILGEARGQAVSVHQHGLYDVEVDTSSTSLKECALLIAESLVSAPRPRALKRHRSRCGAPVDDRGH